MIDVNGVTNPTGNRRIAAVGEMMIAKFFKSGFAVNEIKPTVSEKAVFFTTALL